ncbi:hypothetical protein F7725_024706, partial [Dissostichus mawsoni]
MFFWCFKDHKTYVCLCPAEGSTDPPGGEFRDFLCFSSALSVLFDDITFHPLRRSSSQTFPPQISFIRNTQCSS